MSDSPPPPNALRPMSPTLAPAEETTPLVESTTALLSPNETTPLLSTTVQPSPEASPATPARSKAIYVLTLLSLIFSVTTLVLVAVAFLIAQIMFTSYWFSYILQGSLNTAIATVPSLPLSSRNMYSFLPRTGYRCYHHLLIQLLSPTIESVHGPSRNKSDP